MCDSDPQAEHDVMFRKVTEISFHTGTSLKDTETFATYIWFGSASRCTKPTRTLTQLHQLLFHCCLKLVATRMKTSMRKNKTRPHRTEDGFHPLQLGCSPQNQTIVQILISTCVMSCMTLPSVCLCVCAWAESPIMTLTWWGSAMAAVRLPSSPERLCQIVATTWWTSWLHFLILPVWNYYLLWSPACTFVSLVLLYSSSQPCSSTCSRVLQQSSYLTSSNYQDNKLFDFGFRPSCVSNWIPTWWAITTCTFSQLHICPQDIFILFPISASQFLKQKKKMRGNKALVHFKWTWQLWCESILPFIWGWCSLLSVWTYRQKRSSFL